MTMYIPGSKKSSSPQSYVIFWQYRNGNDKEVRRGQPIQEKLPWATKNQCIQQLNSQCPEIKHWGVYVEDLKDEEE